jgi:methylmalonyl-CoA/ethylmalonyl-CoA epimerase
MPVLTPLHQGISVPDVAAAAAWYQDVFGFTFLREEYAEPLNCKIIFLRLGEFELELFQYLGEDGHPLPPERRMPNEDIKTCGTKHVAYRVENLTELEKTLREKNVDIVMPPFRMGDDLVCFIRDIAGTLIELIDLRFFEKKLGKKLP